MQWACPDRNQGPDMQASAFHWPHCSCARPISANAWHSLACLCIAICMSCSCCCSTTACTLGSRSARPDPAGHTERSCRPLAAAKQSCLEASVSLHHLLVVVGAEPHVLGCLGCCLEQVQRHSELWSSKQAESFLCRDLPWLLRTLGQIVKRSMESQKVERFCMCMICTWEVP